MPYYITQKSDECPNWSVIKESGELIACHDSKQSAIDQAVAISLAEKTDFLGERAAVGSLNVGDWVSWAPLDPTVLGKVEMVQDQFAVVEIYEYEKGIFTTEDKYMLLNVFKLEKVPAPAMLAVELEDEPDLSDDLMPEARLESGPPAVIADIDGTLVTFEGNRNDKVQDYLDSFEDTEIIIVTARLVADRSGTVAELESLGVDFDQLIMKPDADTDSTDYKKATAQRLLETYNVMVAVDDNEAIRSAYADLGITAISPASVPTVDNDIDQDIDSEERAINQEAPAYMRAAARRGLEYYEQGLAGDGVTPGTIREARAMATGEVSDDKWVRIAAWIARHLPDLDSPDADPSSDNYPSAGVVAHLLWGSGPSKRAAQRTKDYADSVVARIRAEETNSMDKKNKWLDVARAIALKIDGPQPESKEPEIRVHSTEIEVRAEGDGMTFSGYASVFNSPSEDLGGFIEYVAPGAFKRSLQSRNEVKLLWNHDAGEPLASLRGGTMQLVEDERGLKVTATLPQTTRGKDVAELLRTKVIDSMSFGFNVIKDTWSRDGQTRTLESVRLFEVSVVSFPAYGATTATVRSAQPTINPDDLADALLKLESGEELDTKSADLINDVVNKLKAQPETEDVVDNSLDLLDLKKKQFDLLLKRI
jgi:uncharacterized protein